MAVWKKVISLIPARSGSKGIPSKNMVDLLGHPLIWYTINASLRCPRISDTYISSDSGRILNYCEKLGCKIVKRPEVYAQDTSSANDVVAHFLGTLAPEIIESETLMLYLQPTSPLRTECHINEALCLLEEKEADALVSVTRNLELPFKSFTIDPGGLLRSLFDERMSNRRRQDLPATYSVNGAIYSFLISRYRDHGGFPSNGAIPYIMKREDSIDVDDLSDLNNVARRMETNFQEIDRS